MKMGHKGKLLRDCLPREFFTDFREARANKLLDRVVTHEMDGRDDRWPGSHKNVYIWWILDGPEGYAVGWNESPCRGWAFPMVILPSHK